MKMRTSKDRQRKLPNFSFERSCWKRGYKFVVGADEVGRGAFAGPIVAGAVVFAPAPQIQNLKFKMQNDGIVVDDSKKLTPRQREKAACWIKENALAWAVGEAPVSVINRLGMGKATRIAFRRAISACIKNYEERITNKKFIIHNSLFKTQFLLVDAFYVPYIRGLGRKNQLAIVNGDEKSISIASASILAKVHRDHLMRRLSKTHPRYAWARNKGYGTREHRQAIEKHGLTRLHRRQFVSGIKNNEVSSNT